MSKPFRNTIQTLILFIYKPLSFQSLTPSPLPILGEGGRGGAKINIKDKIKSYLITDLSSSCITYWACTKVFPCTIYLNLLLWKEGTAQLTIYNCTFKRVSHSTINIKMQIKFKRNSLVCIRWRNKETSQESNVLSNIFKPIFNVISFPCKFYMYFKCNNDPQKEGVISKLRKTSL